MAWTKKEWNTVLASLNRFPQNSAGRWLAGVDADIEQAERLLTENPDLWKVGCPAVALAHIRKDMSKENLWKCYIEISKVYRATLSNQAHGGCLTYCEALYKPKSVRERLKNLRDGVKQEWAKQDSGGCRVLFPGVYK